MKQVIFLHPDLGIGGAERLIIDMAVVLSKYGYFVRILTNHYNENHCFPETRQNYFKVKQIANWVPRNIFGYGHAILAYFKFILLTIYLLLFVDLQNSVIVCDQISAVICLIKWFSKSPVVFYCHFPDLLLSKKGGLLKKLYRYPLNFIEEYSLDFADLILVNSRFTANIYRETFKRYKQNIFLLHPSINTSYINSLKLSNCDEIPSWKKWIFLSINRFEPKKNLLLALEAFVMLRTKITLENWNKTFLILAGGYDCRLTENRDYFEQLKNFCEKNGLQDHVCLLKSPSDEKKFSLIKQCTCLIYTPVNEHFGIVPLEAMYFAKPVIAMNSGGPLETVLHEQTGFLCEPNKYSLATYMNIIMEKDYHKLGFCGKQHFNFKFSFTTFSNNVEDYFEKLISFL